MTTNAGKLILGTLLTIAIAAGAAWAQALSVVTPTIGDFTVTAVIIPGPAGAEVYGSGEGMGADDELEFSVGFGNDQMLRINGVAMGAYDPGSEHTVTADCYEVGGAWFVDVTVVDNLTSQLVGQRLHLPMGGRPDTATADAAIIVSLVAE